MDLPCIKYHAKQKILSPNSGHGYHTNTPRNHPRIFSLFSFFLKKIKNCRANKVNFNLVKKFDNICIWVQPKYSVIPENMKLSKQQNNKYYKQTKLPAQSKAPPPLLAGCCMRLWHQPSIRQTRKSFVTLHELPQLL